MGWHTFQFGNLFHQNAGGQLCKIEQNYVIEIANSVFRNRHECLFYQPDVGCVGGTGSAPAPFYYENFISFK
jgi:hypothetical protein